MRNTAKLARANEVLEDKQDEIERRLVDADREVFRRVIPFFALFAAAFALINATSQAVTRAFTPYAPLPGAGPMETFWANVGKQAESWHPWPSSSPSWSWQVGYSSGGYRDGRWLEGQGAARSQ